ncbi:MAG TPA: hypothetical protein VK589_12095 [Chryseolinea sp.]|nr:hypothetical protein [Chryseolinea sp.]
MERNVPWALGSTGGERTIVIVFVTLTFIALMTLEACTSEESESPAAVDCSGVSLSFVDDVFPVIQASCTRSGCHGSGSNNGPGELLTYSQISKAKSAIQSTVASGEMPKDSRLSTNEKSIILCWIENGASNN